MKGLLAALALLGAHLRQVPVSRGRSELYAHRDIAQLRSGEAPERHPDDTVGAVQTQLSGRPELGVDW